MLRIHLARGKMIILQLINSYAVLSWWSRSAQTTFLEVTFAVNHKSRKCQLWSKRAVKKSTNQINFCFPGTTLCFKLLMLENDRFPLMFSLHPIQLWYSALRDSHLEHSVNHKSGLEIAQLDRLWSIMQTNVSMLFLN